MRERTVTISSAGKTFSFTGWKIGWVTGPARAGARGADGQAVPHLRDRRRRSSPRSRVGAAAAATRTSTRSRATCAAKRDLLCAGLREVGFEVFRPQGTYFVTTDIRPLGYDRRPGVLPRAAAPGRRGGDPAPGVLRRRRGRPAAGAVRLLQARRGARRGLTRSRAATAALRTVQRRYSSPAQLPAVDHVRCMADRSAACSVLHVHWARARSAGRRLGGALAAGGGRAADPAGDAVRTRWARAGPR